MDRLRRKFAQKYRRAREEVTKWERAQVHLIGLFGNAVNVLERLPMLGNNANYGVLLSVENMTNDLPGKQIESLEKIFAALHKTLDELKQVKDALEKIWSDSCQLLKLEKLELTSLEAGQSFGVGPSVVECIKGLEDLYLMHQDEYKLKVAVVKSLTYQTSVADMAAMQSLLADQPNLPPEEVQFAFEFFDAGQSS